MSELIVRELVVDCSWSGAQSSGFVVSVLGGGHDALVVLEGELDFASAPQLRGAVSAVLAAGRRPVFDARGLTFVDCAGLRVFAECAERLSTRDERLAIYDASALLRRLLHLTGLDQWFSVLGGNQQHA